MAEYTESDNLDLEDAVYTTVLAGDIDFEGLVEASEPLLIRGKVSGNINGTANLLIEAEAEVNADIKARSVIIKGKVTGNVTAESIVWILSTGRLTGDIVAQQVVLDAGCFFSGSCTMAREGA